MERKFCWNSEYVCRIQIWPQTKATKTFNWHSPEIVKAHPNSTCNSRPFEAYMSVQSLIWVHSQSNIKLELHFWLEAALWPWGHTHAPVYDLKTWGWPQIKNLIFEGELSHMRLWTPIVTSISLKNPIIKMMGKFGWATVYFEMFKVKDFKKEISKIFSSQWHK